MDTMWQDFRFAYRLSVRKPLVTVVAMLSLIVGLSLATVVFAILNAAVLRPLPVAAPTDLVVVLEQRPTSVQHQMSYPDYRDIRAEQRAFVDVFGFNPRQMVVTIGGATSMINAELVTGGYFGALGVRTLSGRPIADTDDEIGQPPVAVVSERMWRAWGRSLPLESGATVTINNATFAVVGIAPESFPGVVIGRRADVWIPGVQRAIASGNPADTAVTTRRTSWLTVMARRKPGVPFEALTGDLLRIEQGLFPKWGRTEPRKLFAAPGSHGDYIVPDSAVLTLRALLIATGVVLLVACANVANLLMARAADRSRELALRLALGASRLRLVRLLVIESALLCGISALIATGVALAAAGGAARLMLRAGEPVVLDLAIDWRLVVFVSGLALAAAVLSSLAPAMQVLRSTRLAAMADGGRGATTTRLAGRLRSGLLAGQFALTLALVVCAILLMRTVGNLRNADTGFATNEVVLLAASPGSVQYPEARAAAYVTDAIDRLAAVPGVRAAAFARVRPVNVGGSRMTVFIPGYTPQPAEDMEINYNSVTGAYFDAMGIPLLDGAALPVRLQLPPAPAAIAPGAAPAAPVQVVVNETMASRYWPNRRAVGQRFYLGADATGQPADVIGLVPDAKYRAVREDPRPSFYVPLSSRQALDGVFHVRVAGSPSAAIPALRQTLLDLAPGVPLTQVHTLRSQLDLNITDDRLAMTIGAVLAGAAILLAGVGLFSAMAHMVGSRTREIGVRVALGATGGGIQRLVLRHALLITLTGATLGLGLAAWATSITASRLYGVGRFDAASFAGAALMLAAVAIASAVVPARRASRVDPVIALRHD
jgi:predicted permease